MKTRIFLLVAISCFTMSVFAQKQITKSGKIEIFSQTPMFSIEATNNKVASILDTKTGDLVVSTLVRSFKFKEALVEEHFNENYMESHLFPKAEFKGKIANYTDGAYSKDGVYDATVTGKLTIHGVTKDVSEKAKITVKGGSISATTQFSVSLENYGIKVEKSYKDAIKDDVLLKINFSYQPYTK